MERFGPQSIVLGADRQTLSPPSLFPLCLAPLNQMKEAWKHTRTNTHTPTHPLIHINENIRMGIYLSIYI